MGVYVSLFVYIYWMKLCVTKHFKDVLSLTIRELCHDLFLEQSALNPLSTSFPVLLNHEVEEGHATLHYLCGVLTMIHMYPHVIDPCKPWVCMCNLASLVLGTSECVIVCSWHIRDVAWCYQVLTISTSIVQILWDTNWWGQWIVKLGWWLL